MTAGIALKAESRAVQAMSVLVIALMVAIGLIVLAGAASLRHVDADWRRAFSGHWTVEMAPPDPAGQATPDEAAHVKAVLSTAPGVIGVRQLENSEIQKLLEPWLGDFGGIDQLPLPVLLDVRVDPRHPPDPGTLAALLKVTAPDARLDDHGDWTRQLARLARTGETLGLIVLGGIAIVSAATIAATTHARLAINRPEIELLHEVGATDHQIVRQFVLGVLWPAIAGAALGTALAGAGAIGLVRFGGAIAPLAPALHLTPDDWIALGAAPLLAVLLALLVTRATAIALVRRLR
jgi:cell division transport system permease protein